MPGRSGSKQPQIFSATSLSRFGVRAVSISVLPSFVKGKPPRPSKTTKIILWSLRRIISEGNSLIFKNLLTADKQKHTRIQEYNKNPGQNTSSLASLL